ALSTRRPVKDFIILTDFSRCQADMIGRVSRRPKQPIFEGFSMTISFPEMKTGLPLGLAATAVTGCLAVVLLVGLPLPPQDANPVLAKVNGSEIRQSDVALAEEELGPSLAQMDPATKRANVLAFRFDLKIA